MDELKTDDNQENLPDWVELWRTLSRVGNTRREKKLEKGVKDRWHNHAESFNLRVYERWEQRDSSQQFVLQTLEEIPQASVLDVGAGTGTWTILLAPHAKAVTALDSSPAMLSFCKKEVQNAGFENVSFVQGFWPEIADEVPVHDITLCSHAMYGCTDLISFIQAIQKKTLKRIILLLRAPSQNGVMAQAARIVWGHPYDSPNFQIAFQILLELGIYPNVVMENTNLWKQWRNQSLDEALQEMKGRLGLFDDSYFDQQLMNLLTANLINEGDEWIWPPEIRTALVWWDVPFSSI